MCYYNSLTTARLITNYDIILLQFTTTWLLNLDNCYYNLQLNSYYNSRQNTRAKLVFLLIRPVDFFAFLVAFAVYNYTILHFVCETININESFAFSSG